MSERGVFAVDRGIWDHESFAKDPFTEREAFIWLVGEASYRQRKARVGSVVVDLARGQVAHSYRFMAERWKWSLGKVQRFLKRLETDTIIETQSDTGALVVTICNYDKYQKVSLPSDTPSDTAGDTQPIRERYRLEDRKTKEISSETSSLRSAAAPDAGEKAKPERQLVLEELTAVVSPERAQAIVDHRKRIKAPLGAHAAKLLAKSLARSQNPNSAADLMIERGWRGFDPAWAPAQSLAPAAPPAPAPADEDAQWRRKLKRWRETGEWNGHWGNHPETPGFQAICPKNILREFNLERPAA